MEYLIVGCRGLLAVTLLVAVLSKVRSRAALAAFRSSIEAMEVIPRRWVGAVVAATIAGELAVPALLVVPATVPAGFLGAGVLIGTFTASIVAALPVLRSLVPAAGPIPPGTQHVAAGRGGGGLRGVAAGAARRARTGRHCGGAGRRGRRGGPDGRARRPRQRVRQSARRPVSDFRGGSVRCRS
jgi:methylamine utilization protein MauE